MALCALAREHDVLLVAAEESAAQVAQRARRLGDIPERLEVANTTSVESASDLLSERARTCA